MNKKDIIILARPDHSYEIYKEMIKSNLRFVYCSFKLFPSWSKKIISNPRVRFYGKSYSNCFLLTLLHLFRIYFNKPSLAKYEKPLYEFHLRTMLPFMRPKVIHYWPYFCLDSIKKYKSRNPEVETYADLYYPCEHWVLENIRPILESKGIDSKMAGVEMYAKYLDDLMLFEQNFIVPSKFVAETLRQYFPDKHYIIIPYGLARWNNYKKKTRVEDASQIKSFVYAGGITVQKGCDLLVDYFRSHKELTLHLYGSVPSEQKNFFEQYKGCENIVFHGVVPKNLLQEEVSQYDVGIHMSRFDAYSLSVGEIMGAGLPVIVSKNTGICDLVEEIEAGLSTDCDGINMTKRIEEIRTPAIYNRFLDNLDNYLSKDDKTYGEKMVDFYKSRIKER